MNNQELEANKLRLATLLAGNHKDAHDIFLNFVDALESRTGTKALDILPVEENTKYSAAKFELIARKLLNNFRETRDEVVDDILGGFEERYPPKS